MVEKSCHVELLGGATWIVLKHCLHINKFTTLKNILNRHSMCWHVQVSPCLILSLGFSEEVGKGPLIESKWERQGVGSPSLCLLFEFLFIFSWEFIKISFQNEYFCEVWLPWHSHNTLMFIYVVCFLFLLLFSKWKVVISQFYSLWPYIAHPFNSCLFLF